MLNTAAKRWQASVTAAASGEAATLKTLNFQNFGGNPQGNSQFRREPPRNCKNVGGTLLQKPKKEDGFTRQEKALLIFNLCDHHSQSCAG